MGRIPKRLLFTVIANNDFLGTINTNSYKFQHFGLRSFAMYVNGRQSLARVCLLILVMRQLWVTRLFEGSGIHHLNSGLQITHA